MDANVQLDGHSAPRVQTLDASRGDGGTVDGPCSQWTEENLHSLIARVVPHGW